MFDLNKRLINFFFKKFFKKFNENLRRWTMVALISGNNQCLNGDQTGN
jgi:hypothetical protein